MPITAAFIRPVATQPISAAGAMAYNSFSDMVATVGGGGVTARVSATGISDSEAQALISRKNPVPIGSPMASSICPPASVSLLEIMYSDSTRPRIGCGACATIQLSATLNSPAMQMPIRKRRQPHSIQSMPSVSPSVEAETAAANTAKVRIWPMPRTSFGISRQPIRKPKE